MTCSISYEYIAGFLDGEGSIILLRSGAYRNVQLMVCFSNTHLELLQALQKQLGGVIVVGKRKQGWRQGHMLSITDKDRLQPLLENILPHLIIKQEQCILALKYLETVERSRLKLSNDKKALREVMFDFMQQLNKRGSNEAVECES